MSTTFDPEIERTVKAAVRRYKSRCWWIDERDLYNWGAQVALEALATWDPARGPRTVYVRSALVKGLWRRVLRESAPVSAPDHDLRELSGLRRAPVTAAYFHVDPTPWADQLLEDKAWSRRVSHMLRAATKNVPDGHMGLSVLMGAKPREVARSYRTTTPRVQQAATEVQEVLASLPSMRLLLRSRS